MGSSCFQAQLKELIVENKAVSGQSESAIAKVRGELNVYLQDK